MPSFRPEHVRPRTVASLAEQFGCTLTGDGGVQISGVTSSSQSVRAGDLFVAIAGASGHGARFAPAAIAAGAAAVLTDAAGSELLTDAGVPVVVTEHPRQALGPVSAWLYGSGSFSEHDDQLVFGVTGTNGKTSVVYLLAALAQALGRPVALSSTAERRIESEVSVSGLTTPEANEIHALLAAARERDVRTAVLEVSAHALSRNRVDGVSFDVVGFSNLSHDHLDDYPDMQHYYEAKRELFTPERARRGVVVVDDDWGQRLVGESRIPVTTLSARGEDADWQVRVIEELPARTSFELTGNGRRVQASVPLLGAFSATNAALAIVMWIEAGWDLEHIADAIGGELAAYIPGRAEPVSSGTGPLVLIDYAHTPDAFVHLLAALRRVSRGTLIMVFGADGDRDSSKRAEMGAIAARGADRLVITDFHPRFEDPAAIRSALIAGARSAVPDREILEIADPRAAIRAAISGAQVGDIVVYAGPGHEDYHEVAGVKIPYSARAEARAALIEAGWTSD